MMHEHDNRIVLWLTYKIIRNFCQEKNMLGRLDIGYYWVIIFKKVAMIEG